MAPFTQILVPLDLAGGDAAAIGYAARIAEAFDAEVVLLHLHQAFASRPEPEMREAGRVLAEHVASLEKRGRVLAEHVASLEKRGLEARKISGVMDLPTVGASELICDAARHEHADLIVMSTHGRQGLKRILLGSVTEEVVRAASCPVLVVHDEARTRSA
jgi:nucleotide-binding universal stress UspA family protein